MIQHGRVLLDTLCPADPDILASLVVAYRGLSDDEGRLDVLTRLADVEGDAETALELGVLLDETFERTDQAAYWLRRYLESVPEDL